MAALVVLAAAAVAAATVAVAPHVDAWATPPASAIGAAAAAAATVMYVAPNAEPDPTRGHWPLDTLPRCDGGPMLSALSA